MVKGDAEHSVVVKSIKQTKPVVVADKTSHYNRRAAGIHGDAIDRFATGGRESGKQNGTRVERRLRIKIKITAK